MDYFSENNNVARMWAVGVTAGLAVVTAAALTFVSVEVGASESRNNDVILVEYIEPEPPVETPPPPPIKTVAPKHTEVAKVEQTEPIRGEAEQTQTVNQRALFSQSLSGRDEPQNAGNPFAREADSDTASGAGDGLKPDGSDALDAGLLGRGLVGALPQPAYPGNRAGKVLIRVTIDEHGRVTSAEYEPVGSTTSDAELVRSARTAAMQARFTESSAHIDGGVITYVFKMK